MAQIIQHPAAAKYASARQANITQAFSNLQRALRRKAQVNAKTHAYWCPDLEKWIVETTSIDGVRVQYIAKTLQAARELAANKAACTYLDFIA